MKVQIPPQIPQQQQPAPAPRMPQRRLDAADLADLTQQERPPAEPARTPASNAQPDTRPLRPGSLLDIRV